MVSELEKLPLIQWATFHAREGRGKEVLRLIPASSVMQRRRMLLNRVLWGSCEDVDVDTVCSRVWGPLVLVFTVQIRARPGTAFGCLIIAALLPDWWYLSLPTGVKFCVSTLAMWWPVWNFPGAFESNLLPDTDLLNFFLFCWRHFLVCKMYSRW